MGYCQGLNYLATTFFNVCGQNEIKTFQTLHGFVTKLNLQGMYTKQVYEFFLQEYVLNQLIKTYLHDIFIHLTKKLQINLNMITTQWIMTFFVGYITDETLILPILDNFILEKTSQNISEKCPLASYRVLFGYILSVLSKNQE